MNCFQSVFFLTNLAIGICSGLIIFFIVENETNVAQKSATYLFSVGGIGIFVCLSGLFAAMKRNIHIAIMYAIIVLIFSVGQIVGKLYVNNLEIVALHEFEQFNIAWDNMVKNLTCENKQFKQEKDCVLIAGIETKYGCCGKTSSKDYSDDGLVTPLRCYKPNQAQIVEGCVKAIKDKSNDNLDHMSYIELGNILTTIFSFMISLLWICSNSNSKYATDCFELVTCKDDFTS